MEMWSCIFVTRMEEKTIWDGKEERKEYRYYIISLGQEIETVKRAVRGHWSIESIHWHLDVTFREDANTTLDKQAAQNQNIIRKWILSILKMIEIIKPGLSLWKKRFATAYVRLSILKKYYLFKKCKKGDYGDENVHTFIVLNGQDIIYKRLITERCKQVEFWCQ